MKFNDLRSQKIMLCECKMSFETGSLRCVKYIEEKTNTVSAKFVGSQRQS